MYEIKSEEFKNIYSTLSSRYGNYEVFYDFVKMVSISMYNSFAKNEKWENEYLSIINKYPKNDQELFTKWFSQLIIEFDRANKIKIIDILGPFYEKNNFGNASKGQFFTPSHISDFMAKAIMESKEEINNKIERDGFITFSEPTCGAGGIILSYVNALRKRNINYQKDLLVIATDISDICVYMTYIQLSLYGIPAIVRCGDTLSNNMKFTLATPFYFIQQWKFIEQYKNTEIVKENNQQNERIKENKKILKEVSIKGNLQLTLF